MGIASVHLLLMANATFVLAVIRNGTVIFGGVEEDARVYHQGALMRCYRKRWSGKDGV